MFYPPGLLFRRRRDAVSDRQRIRELDSGSKREPNQLQRMGVAQPDNRFAAVVEIRTGLELDKAMLLSSLRLIGRLLFKILFAVEYHGLENVPREGPVIIAGNHPSYLDPVLVGLPLDRVVRFMAWDAIFKIPILGWLTRVLGAFPVDLRRGKGDAAFKQACRVLESGEALGIFPEAQRSEGPAMGELRSGAARLALETGAPIVPVAIGGASRAWPKWKLLPKPAKIVVRFHEPITVSGIDRASHGSDREFHHKVMEQVAARINRSLTPALRGAEAFEKWYRQPPSHIRSYEWAPLVAAIIASLVTLSRGGVVKTWVHIYLPPFAYYAYLAADLLLIRQNRTAKWLRNSMPIWLIFIWRAWLTESIGIPAGRFNGMLVCGAVAALLPFFWEDYLTLQKFVRGLTVSYYFSLALLLRWPHELGALVSVLGFVVLFNLGHRVILRYWTASAALILIAISILANGPATMRMLPFALLPLVTLAYLRTFVGAAYDIRRAGDVVIHSQM